MTKYVPKKKKIPTIRELVKEANTLFPNSKHLRKQWVRKTIELINGGKHILYGGEIKWGLPTDNTNETTTP